VAVADCHRKVRRGGLLSIAENGLIIGSLPAFLYLFVFFNELFCFS